MICEKCGRVLLDGEICPCQQDAITKRNNELLAEEAEKRRQEAWEAQVKEAENAQKRENASKLAATAKNITADISGGIFNDVMAIFKHPTEGISDFIKEGNIVNACVIGAISALSFALFGAALFSNFVIALILFLAAIAGIVGTGAGFFIVSKIRKKSISPLTALNYSIPGAVYFIPFAIVALILAAFNKPLGLFVIMLAFLAKTAMDSLTLSLMTEEKDKQPIFLTLISGLSLVATFLIIGLFSKIIVQEFISSMFGMIGLF